ncbi:MAG: phosphatase PAP2 family protein [Waddliaceae bacterium]|nr:phosphatase PAP2 family protein [Waddliaceae bacterium]
MLEFDFQRFKTSLFSFLLFLMCTQSTAIQARDPFTKYGDCMQFIIPTTSGVISLLKGDKEGVKQLIATGAIATVVVYSLKYSVNRERPDGYPYSFPSGHSSGSFVGASYLHYRYGWKWGLPAYLASVAVGWSRVHADRHYWSDVVGAAVIANLTAFFFVEAYDKDVRIIPCVRISKPYFGIIGEKRF